MNKNAFLFIVIVLNSCNLFHLKQGGVHLYYSDIDIFTMQGKDLLKSDKPLPPCFEIDSIGPNKVRLTNWYPKIGPSSLDYTYQNKYWSTSFSVFADTVDLTIYNYIGQGKFISLEYINDSSNNKLKTATICKDSVEIIYRFKSYYKIAPSGDINSDSSFSDNDLQEKVICDYRIKNGILEITKLTAATLPGNIEKEITHYKIADHSIFWWREFGR